MPLTEFQRAGLRQHLHHADQVRNDDGDPAIAEGGGEDAIDDAIEAHEAAINPHGTYLTQAEADALYAPLAYSLPVEFVIDGGGAAITTGIKGDVEIPDAGTITSVRLLADQSGSIVIDIWKDTYANFPPTDADSITASAPPTISSATKSQDTTLTGWTTSVAAGDILRFNVDSATTITRVTLSLQILRS
jgi:hypothetical protein